MNRLVKITNISVFKTYNSIEFVINTFYTQFCLNTIILKMWNKHQQIKFKY